jgi:hypothetical protein
VAGRTFQALSNSHTTCNIDTGVIGYDNLRPVTCVVDVPNSKIVLYNVYSLTNTQLKIFYHARMACSQSGFDVMVKAFANPQAYAETNWALYGSQTNQGWSLNRMWYSRHASWSVRHDSNNPERPYNAMSPAVDAFST